MGVVDVEVEVVEEDVDEGLGGGMGRGEDVEEAFSLSLRDLGGGGPWCDFRL